MPGTTRATGSALPIALVGLLAAMALSCGGSGGGGGGFSGGIGGSGISQGAISGFGSVFVTGVEWVTSATTTVVVDDQVATESDLQLGMVVLVQGTRTGTASADRVEFDEDVEGPIESIVDVGNDGDVKQLQVLGTTVLAERGSAVYDGVSFDTLMVGDVIEVSGFFDPAGVLDASRIERKGTLVLGTTVVEIHGVVSGFAGGTTFTVDGIAITFDPSGVTTDLSDAPGGPLNGQTVEVKGVLSAAAAITATRIEHENTPLPDAEEAEIEGLISNFANVNSFDVNGIPVSGFGAQLVPNDPSLFGDGVRVEVEGELRSGLLTATRIERRGFDQRIEAALASDLDVDPAAGTLVLLGITVTTDSGTLLEDDLDTPDFSLSDLRGGDFLNVRGVENATGGLLATLIERKDSPDDVKLRGTLDAFDGTTGTLTILGVVVQTDGMTRFENADEVSRTPTEFFAEVQTGDVVEAKDLLDGDQSAIDVADAVEIESVAASSGASGPVFAPIAPAPSSAAAAAAGARSDEASFAGLPPAAAPLAGESTGAGAGAAGAAQGGAPEATVGIVEAVQRFFSRMDEVGRRRATRR